MYVAVRASGLAHRGGTLTVLADAEPSSRSTRPSPISTPLAVMILTNDGLAGFRRVGGSDGARSCPTSPSSLPAPTDGGRSYRFQLRPGIRYSTGALVRPAGLPPRDRTLARCTRRRGRIYFAGIVGAEGAHDAEELRPLARDRHRRRPNTVTFHLTAPDPDFLLQARAARRLRRARRHAARTRALPLPATGPYDDRVVRPEARRPARPQPAVPRVVAGRPAERLSRMRSSSASAAPPTRSVTRRPARERPISRRTPTGRVRGRAVCAADAARKPARAQPDGRALLRLPQHTCGAVRRRQGAAGGQLRRRPDELLDTHRGADFGQMTCQALPPNFDGYRRYCPYTLHPDPAAGLDRPGSREGPGARRRIGHRGQVVTVWSAWPYFDSRARYIASVLESLGYRTRIKSLKDLGELLRVRQRFTEQGSGWNHRLERRLRLARPASSDQLLTCASYVPHSSRQLEHLGVLRPGDRCAKSPTPARSRRAIPRRRRSSGPRSTATSSTRLRGSPSRTARAFEVVSSRVGNYQYNPQWGTLLDQLWVR